MKVYDERLLPYTKEYFLNRKPEVQQWFIWIILSILLFTFVFIAVAPFEEVVKVTGYIRPEDNISCVVNAVSGRVKTVLYESGKTVSKGDLLLEIDPTQLENEKESLVSKMDEEFRNLTALYQIKESIEKDKNLVNRDDYYEAYLRFELWKIELKKLENIKNLNKEKYQQEKRLPASMTTKARLHELENQYKVSQSEYESLLYSFPHDIETQIHELETSKKMNEAKLNQIEDSLMYTLITSPIDGIIQEVTRYNSGDYIQAGQEVLNIIPQKDGTIKAELSIPARQAGKIEKGMKVKMRFPGLPYNEFGGAEGNIITIDPDITKTGGQEAFFIIKTDLDKTFLEDKKGKKYPLKTGLQADARIILSNRTILSYILEKLNLWY
jgi:multidrug efflux pump subunit AcrA (membrane-fusion protein)